MHYSSNSMNPVLEKVTFSSKSSFALKEEILPYIEIGWHVHPEFELTLFTESTGRMFIGDHTDSFGSGTLLLLGPHLPHYMRNDEVYYQGKEGLRIRAVVVHFSEHFPAPGFFDLPEFINVKRLLRKSGRGIQVRGETQKLLAPKMEQLLELEGYERFRCLLDILQEISISPNLKRLSSIGYQNVFEFEDVPRINKAFDYLLQHFSEDVSLEAVADRVNMSKPSFCKFFKKRTGKTFTQTLNEIRIGHACRLFIEKGMSVSEVCYACGYNNLSYFNRKFKAITKYSPLEYRKRFYVPMGM